MLWGFGDGRLPPGGWLRWRAALLAADFGQGFAPHPTLFLCLAKEIGERKATRASRSALRADSPVLLESQGRPGMARRLRRRLAGPETSLTFCDARRATRG
jgi:hypothetical protein